MTGVGGIGRGPASDGTLSAAFDGVEVTLKIVGGKVVSAKLAGALEESEVAAFRIMEDCLVGVTFREAAEHGAIYAMDRLSDSRARPVRGVMLPKNMNPHLQRVEQIVRKLYLSWEVGDSAKSEDWNFEDRGLSETWTMLAMADKLARIRTLLGEFLMAKAMASGSLSIVIIDKHDRIDVRFGDQIPIEVKPKLLMDFERFLRTQTGERLEVFVTELKDLNRIRRL